MSESDNTSTYPPSPPVIAALGWLVPGLGYWLIGEKRRALYAGVAILLVFVSGILISGVRCIDVPGYDYNGNLRQRNGKSLIMGAPVAAILDKPWYIPQIMAGPITIGSSVWSVKVSPTYSKATARLFDIGTLYTAVAGMLNLLVIIDSAYRGAKLREANPQFSPM